MLITAGASAPEDVVQECVEYLETNFGATFQEETIREENVHFPLPRVATADAVRRETIAGGVDDVGDGRGPRPSDAGPAAMTLRLRG